MEPELDRALSSFNVTFSSVSEEMEEIRQALSSFNLTFSSRVPEEVENLRKVMNREAEKVRKEKESFEKTLQTLKECHFASRVKLNVGGKTFETTIQTLKKYPGSMLHSMFSGRFQLQGDEDGSFFIDRNGELFRYILDYLRNGVLGGPLDEDIRNEILKEMVQLVEGSGVYIYQGQKNAAFDSRPTRLVRNLIRLFFNEEILKVSNYGGGGAQDYERLDPVITAAVIGYAMDPEIISTENQVTKAKLIETINKMCYETRRRK